MFLLLLFFTLLVVVVCPIAVIVVVTVIIVVWWATIAMSSPASGRLWVGRRAITLTCGTEPHCMIVRRTRRASLVIAVNVFDGLDVGLPSVPGVEVLAVGPCFVGLHLCVRFWVRQ
jgi:hypothetical protein